MGCRAGLATLGTDSRLVHASPPPAPGRRGADAATTEEASATQAFIRVLQDLFSSKTSCSRHEWMSHRPPKGAFTAAQERTFIGIINEILENEAAVRGMLATFRAEIDSAGGDGGQSTMAAADGPLAAFDTMMRRLFAVLDANRSGGLDAGEVRALTQALLQGSEGLGQEEQAATKAFIGAVEAKLAGVSAIRLEAWLAIAPLEGSFSPSQALEVVQILTEILDDDEAVEGLLRHCRGGS